MCSSEIMLRGRLLHIIISFFTHKVHDSGAIRQPRDSEYDTIWWCIFLASSLMRKWMALSNFQLTLTHVFEYDFIALFLLLIPLRFNSIGNLPERKQLLQFSCSSINFGTSRQHCSFCYKEWYVKLWVKLHRGTLPWTSQIVGGIFAFLSNYFLWILFWKINYNNVFGTPT